MNEEIKIKEIEQYIKDNYKGRCVSSAVSGSSGNMDDCYYDGEKAGTLATLFEISKLLGMNLVEIPMVKEDWE